MVSDTLSLQRWRGEAQRNMQHLAIGRVLINLQGEQIVDDSGWSPELDLVETGSIVPIGRINVFVGMVGTSSPALQYSDSVSEAGSMEQSDGRRISWNFGGGSG